MHRFAAFLLFYALLILFHGYTFGSNDHIELMPYVKWLHDRSLYQSDFFIQHIANRIPNERIITAYLLSIGSNFLDWWAFSLHAVATLGLLYGLFFIAKLFIDEEWKIWIFLLVLFFPLYHFNLGGNDVYYNSLSASSLSKSLGVWSIYFVLKDRFYRATIFASLATFFHPLAGFQVFALSFGGRALVFLQKIMWDKSIPNHSEIRTFYIAVSLYIFTAGIWIAALFSHFQSASLPDDIFFEIINFRLPHHFIPGAFGIKNYVVFAVLSAIALRYFHRENKVIFFLFCIALSGMLIYGISVGVLHKTALISTQWFKTGIWLKPLGLVSVVATLLSFAQSKKLPSFFIHRFFVPVFLAMLCCSVAALQLSHSFLHFTRKYELPFDNPLNANNDEIQVALMAKRCTPKNALFLTPASCTAFKYYSERSSYIDFKAVTHSKADLKEWYDRIKKVYRIDASKDEKGLALIDVADNNFTQMDTKTIVELSKSGITHVLTFSNIDLPFPVIAQSSTFTIYALQ